MLHLRGSPKMRREANSRILESFSWLTRFSFIFRPPALFIGNIKTEPYWGNIEWNVMSLVPGRLRFFR